MPTTLHLQFDPSQKHQLDAVESIVSLFTGFSPTSSSLLSVMRSFPTFHLIRSSLNPGLLRISVLFKFPMASRPVFSLS